MQNLRLIIKKSRLIGVILVLIALSSCAPEIVPEVETPTSTATARSTPTRTVTPTPEFTPTPTEVMGLEVDPGDLEGTVVRFAHPWVGEPAETLADLAREFSLSNPYGIWVEVYPHGGEAVLVESLLNHLDGEEMPGMIAVSPYLGTALGEDYSLADLSPYYDDPEWGLSAADQQDIPPVLLEPFILNDEMFALPLAPQATVLFYNRTWGEALGYSEPPKDLEMFESQTCDATFANWQGDGQQGGTGGWLINLDPKVLASWYYAFDGVIPVEDIPAFNNEAGQDAFGYLWGLKNEGCIWFGLQPDPFAYFAERIALVYAGQLDQIPLQTSWMAVAGSEDEWQVLGFPGPGGEQILIDGPALMIRADAPEQELAAWLFSKYLLAPNAQAELVKSLFSLPVRTSAMDLLTDFKVDYPQWAQGAALIDSASVLPVSGYWRTAQWALQDAANRIFQAEEDNVILILKQLDDLIVDLVESDP